MLRSALLASMVVQSGQLGELRDVSEVHARWTFAGTHCRLSCTCRFDLANFNGLLQGHVDHEGVHRWL